MQEKVEVEILLLFLCILGIVPVIIFFMRKNDTGIDYYRIINKWNNMEEQNLENSLTKFQRYLVELFISNNL
ncbi:MAG: hypothetical protein IJD92_00570 [Bacilli bacterium]|nr:hypothetical protein [Bacilli bacterium]